MVAISFAASFGSHMVLQQAPARASLWGFAPASAQLGQLLSARGAAHYDEAKVHLEAAVAQLPAWSAVMGHMPGSSHSSAASEAAEGDEIRAAPDALPLLASCHESLSRIAGTHGDTPFNAWPARAP